MTPGHYCTHALVDLLRTQASLSQFGARTNEDCTYLQMLIEDLPKASKFMLPDGGRLLDDNTDPKSLVENLHLPFPLTVAEYTMDPKGAVAMREHQVISSRRIVYCMEADTESGYLVSTIDYIDHQRVWQPCPIMLSIPYNLSERVITRFDGISHELAYTIVMPATLRHMCHLLGITVAEKIKRSVFETAWDWKSIVHLTNVLACSNVETDLITPSPKLNKKREATGKLPMYEYKVLKIAQDRHHNAPQRTGATGGHASPRQHVRRGHIRHIGANPKRSDETKRLGYTKWINQMLVGDPDLGRIEKDYVVDKRGA